MSGICKRPMGKEMSDWLRERIESGQYERVKKGYVMKSEDCTIAFFPDWNCNEQFRDIVKKLK